jgi:hypothetical protein
VRAKPHLAAALTLATAMYFAAHAAATTVSPRAADLRALGSQATETADPDATPTGTPVVDPAPSPVPLYLPAALRDHDYKAPGPVVASARGFLSPLSADERSACDPATHVLRERADATSDPVAVAYPLRPDDISTVLDLYMGSYVELIGAEALTQDPCDAASRIMGVDRVRVLDEPGRPTPVR